MFIMHSSAEAIVDAGDYDKLAKGVCLNCGYLELVVEGGRNLNCEHSCLENRLCDYKVLTVAELETLASDMHSVLRDLPIFESLPPPRVSWLKRTLRKWGV